MPRELLSGAGAGIAVSAGTEDQSPEERAKRYFAKAEEARLLVSRTADPLMQEILKKLVADWEYLAAHVLKQRL